MSEPIPVWLFASSFEPRGTSLYTLRLARALVGLGFAPTIVCESAAWIPERFLPSLRLREVPGLASGLFTALTLHRLYRVMGTERPALIHAQRRTLNTMAAAAAAAFECPYLMTVHDLLPIDVALDLQSPWLGGIIAISPSVERELLLTTPLPPSCVHMIPTGVEVPAEPRMPPARDSEVIPTVGTCSALEPVKGLTYFLMAAELILSAGHDVEFLIAGSGPDEETLRRAAQHLDIANRVTFVGYLPEYTEVLEAIDLFVLPALEQGLGTLMFEAMSLCRPVVATRVGGIVDFVTDNEQALLVPAANHIVLAEKIRYLLNNPDKARRLAVNGQKLVREQFTVERMAERTSDVYRKVLDRFRRINVPDAPVSPADCPTPNCALSE